MVVLVDLDDEAFDPYNARQAHPHPLRKPATERVEVDEEDERPNPNINGFSAALSCYPIVSQLATLLDLNSLHDLSRTCRQFRANLLQFRKQLVTQTLRCSNEDKLPGPRLGDLLRMSHQAWNVSTYGTSGGRVTSGKVGACARDMVGECRRCGTVNCTTKPPPPSTLLGRHRRLCRTCIKAPLSAHTSTPPDTPAADLPAGDPTAFTYPAFAHGTCTCADSVWICQPCGLCLRSADTTYMRGWTWRTRYSTYLGGLGTGIGEGNEGVECGRHAACLAARNVEKEIDCDADELAQLKRELAHVEAGRWQGTSYLAQEMEGIGGVVKKKVRKRVRVGATVKEWEDERERGGYLGREQKGLVRSWCSWCERVVLGKKDVERESGTDELSRWPSASSSSAESSGASSYRD